MVDESHPPAKSEITWLTQVQPKKLEWLVKGLISYGTLTLVQGGKGVGKSCLVAALAADVTGGPRFLRQRWERKGQCVLWLSGEEDVRRMAIPRLRAAGVDFSRCAVPTGQLEQQAPAGALLWDHVRLKTYLQGNDIRLIVADPVTSCSPPGIPTSDDRAMRGWLEPLLAVLAECRTALVGIQQLLKHARGPIIDQGIGSRVWTALARSVLRADLDPADPSNPTRVLWTPASNQGESSLMLAYRLSVREDAAPTVEVLGPWEGDRSQLEEGSLTGAERDTDRDCRAFLVAELLDGPKMARDMISLAKSQGFGERALRRAKASLRLRYYSSGPNHCRVWHWELPDQLPSGSKLDGSYMGENIPTGEDSE